MSQPGKSELQLETGVGAGAAAGEGEGTATQFGEFKTAEELLAAYTALKATPPAKKEDESGSGAPAKIEEEATGDEVADALKAVGLNQDDFTKEFAETGDLSEESRKKLESKGFPRAMVDTYLAGLRTHQEAYNAAIFTPAGGEKGYVELITWAKDNLTADEKRAFNDAIGSGDASRAALAVQAIAAKKGTKPAMLNGKTTSALDSGAKPFESNAQVVEAMRDPRYRRDPAYRKTIADRLAVSAVFK